MTTPAMTFHESYGGELPVGLLRLIKRTNVSPADYWMLQDEFGSDNFGAITEAIRDRSNGPGDWNGLYRAPWPLG